MIDLQPFFSVIIPTYNRQPLLKVAVESVLEQNFTDFELLIIDDGSTDATGKYLSSIHDQRVRFFHQNNRGPAAARNLGIKNTHGKFICFLDSDDRFRIEKLAKTHEFIHRYPTYRVFHTEEIWYRNGCFLAQHKKHKKPDGNIFQEALKICSISISTACIKKDVFAQIGIFDEQLPACEDYEFWLRVTAVFPVKHIPLYLTIKEGGRFDQQSKRIPALDQYRIQAIKKIIADPLLERNYRDAALRVLQEKTNIYIRGLQKRDKTKAQKIEEETKRIIEYYRKQ